MSIQSLLYMKKEEEIKQVLIRVTPSVIENIEELKSIFNEKSVSKTVSTALKNYQNLRSINTNQMLKIKEQQVKIQSLELSIKNFTDALTNLKKMI